MTTWAQRLAVLKAHADVVSAVPGFRSGWDTRPQFMELPAANLAVKLKIRGLRQYGYEATKIVETVEPVGEVPGSDVFVSRALTHKRLRVEYKFEAQREEDSFLVWDFANGLWNRLATEPYREALKAVEMAVVRREPMVDYETVSMGRKLSVAMFEVLYSFRDVHDAATEIIEDAVLTITTGEKVHPPVSLPGFPA